MKKSSKQDLEDLWSGLGYHIELQVHIREVDTILHVIETYVFELIIWMQLSSRHIIQIYSVS